MTRLPIVDFKTMEKILFHIGFQAVRRKGSHVFYRHSDGRTPHCLVILEEIWPAP